MTALTSRRHNGGGAMQETESDDGDYQNNEGLFSFRETVGAGGVGGVP